MNFSPQTNPKSASHHPDFFGGYTVIMLSQNLQDNGLDKYNNLLYLKYKTLEYY